MNINSLKGIGPKLEKLFNNIGIYTTEDLINYYPFRYDIIKRSNIDSLYQDDKIIIDGIVESNPSLFYFNKKMNKMSFKLNTGKYLLNVIIFNRGYLKNKIKIGNTVSVIGKYDKMHNTVVANNINLSPLPTVEKIVPIYHQVAGLSSNQISNYINQIVDYEPINYLPDSIINKYNFIDKKTCINEVHNPSNMNNLKKALNMLKYEELFLFMLKMESLKYEKKYKIGIKRIVPVDAVNDFISSLPFKLTTDQEKCTFEVLDDLNSKYTMNRLIQGDVGSGKTLVAIIALYINYLSGYQGILMAPTEVLAQQHFKSLKKFFKDYNINIEILTGNLKQREKKDIINRLESNKIDILIGTHALFSDNVFYNKLGLVITDEQHRFGVNQRSSIKNKGTNPDVLYLSATPIPRTLALTIYGDMDVSSIKSMPSGRKEIKTILKSSKSIKDVLNLMYAEIKNNHQIYVIAPLIEESDKIDLENVEVLEEKMNRAFSKVCNIGVMHGKMSADEKDSVMKSFKENRIQILISTTVIEVGVDVENATTIVIFDAYRFGLSQLHQLRGRVGRNSLQSYCILVSDRETSRLNIMTKVSDGFKIAEEDFKLRGSGDIFGVRQSGDMNFKLADFKNDYGILIKAKEDSKTILNNISNYPILEKLLNESTNLN